VVDQRDHAVIVGRHLGELAVALFRDAGALRAEFEQGRVRELRRAPPAPPCATTAGAPDPAPGSRGAACPSGRRASSTARAVECMVRVGKRRPRAERGVGLRLSRSQAMVRSAIQVLLCQAPGSPEDHVCAASVPGRSPAPTA
jgi:hypothetical protein